MNMRNVYISTLMLLFATGTQVQAQDNMSESSRAVRRIAVALPKAPPTVVKPVVLTPVATQAKVYNPAPTPSPSTSKLNPEKEFASHPYSPKEKKTQDGLKSAIIDSASKAELISRSYNRRLADLIVWLANSMQGGTSYTPQASYFKPSYSQMQTTERKAPLVESRQEIFQID